MKSIDAMKLAVYRKSFYEFFKDAFKVLETGNDLVDNWHIKYFCDHLQADVERIVKKQKRLHHDDVMISPRSSKTLLFSIVFPAWCWINYPHLKFLTFSYTQKRTNENAKNFRDLLESPWYKKYFGDKFKLTSDAIENISNNKRGYRHSYGLTGFTGDGADIIIIDDPQEPRASESRVKRETVIEFYRAVASRLNNAEIGKIYICQQRLHRDDLSGFLFKNAPLGSYKFFHLPALLDNKVTDEFRSFYQNGYFDPIRLSQSILDAKKSPAELGERAFRAQFLQAPVDNDAGLIKEKWLQIMSVTEFFEKHKASFYKWDFFLDTAYGGKDGDYNAILCATKIQDNVYIKYVEQNKKEFPDLLRHVKSLTQSHGSIQSLWYVEPTAAGKPLVQSFKLSNLNVVEGKPPTKSKLERVNAISPFLEGLKVHLVTDDEGDDWSDQFIGQCLSFTGESGDTDDMVDTLTMCLDKFCLNSQETVAYWGPSLSKKYG